MLGLGRLLAHGARIRYRLLLINIIVAIVPIAGISFARMHERQLLAALETDMIHEAELVRTVKPDAAALIAAERDTGMWIRILDDHELRDEAFEDRPEIRAALAGRYGSATRLARAPVAAHPRHGRPDIGTEQGGELDTVHLFVALPVRDAAGRVTSVVYVSRSTRDVKLQLYHLRESMFHVALVALAITLLLTLVLATTIARPLGKLTRRAQRIAAHAGAPPDDHLDRRRDEIGQLARAVTAMTGELDRRARDARTLAADISHELKTPLAGIRGAAELLGDGAADDAATRSRFLAMIVDDAARIDRLVNRLLELARVEDDRAAPTAVDVAELARAAAARAWAAPVRVAGGDRDRDRDRAAAITRGRAAAIASAIDNLVANAVQHADPGTAVDVTVTRGTHVRVSVANHGPALSEAARARVWDRFYSTRVDRGGSGLGLAIVRSVALAHGGDYGVSCADGETTFWFEC